MSDFNHHTEVKEFLCFQLKWSLRESLMQQNASYCPLLPLPVNTAVLQSSFKFGLFGKDEPKGLNGPKQQCAVRMLSGHCEEEETLDHGLIWSLTECFSVCNQTSNDRSTEV